jgi:hypothetical protein
MPSTLYSQQMQRNNKNSRIGIFAEEIYKAARTILGTIADSMAINCLSSIVLFDTDEDTANSLLEQMNLLIAIVGCVNLKRSKRLIEHVAVSSNGRLLSMVSVPSNPQVQELVDLVLRINDNERSCGLVDIATNHLILCSKNVVISAGRDARWVMGEGRDMSKLWDAADLFNLNRELRQRGVLSKHPYQAYTNRIIAGEWRKVKVDFVAQKIEILPLLGNDYRLTWGVEIAS